MEPRVTVFSSAAALTRQAAEEFVQRAAAAVRSAGVFRVALSGGSTPKSLYALLAEEAAYRDRLPWEQIQWFWGDERSVGPDDPQSNYRMAREALFSKVRVPEANVHRIHGESPSAEEAARSYAETLRRAFGLAADALPRFDLVLLGMGPDGHTASLFPGTSPLRAGPAELTAAAWVDKLTTYRVTLTPAVINHAAAVLFLVTGADKADALRHVLEGEPEPLRYPSQLVRPRDGELLWLLDQAAAGQLAKTASAPTA